MLKILVIRHGYSEGNQKNVFCGKTEVDLTPLGLEQGRLVSKFVYDNYKIDGIYTSALSRTKRTVEYLSELTGIESVGFSEFNEKSLGRWEGKGIKEIQDLYKEEYEWSIKDPINFKPLEGESYPELIERVFRGLKKIEEKHQGKDATVVLATHGGVVRALEIIANGEEGSKIKLQQNATVTEMTFEEDKLKVLVRGISDFLGDK